MPQWVGGASEFGAFISCIPGKLRYFEYEGKKSAYLLKKQGRNVRYGWKGDVDAAL